MVQDFATQWIQSYPCKTRTSQETEKSLRKFLEPSHKPKVICTGNSLEFGKSCEDLSWNRRTSTPHRSETSGVAERAVRRVKDGTSAVLLQSGLDERWWAVSIECCRYLRNVQDLLADGKTPYVRRFGEPFKGPISSDFNARFIKTSSIWQESITWYLSWVSIDRGRNLEWRYSNCGLGISGKDGCTEKHWIHRKKMISYSQRQMVQQNCQEEISLRREQPLRSEGLSGEVQGESEESQPAEPTDDAEARGDFWSIQGDFINRHHNEPRVQLNVPKEETFPAPLKYIDVARSAHSDLYWNVDSNRSVSDLWKGFTKFTVLRENLTEGHTWSRRRLTKVQTTTRPNHVWPEVWTKIGKATQNREKQERKNERPKLDKLEDWEEFTSLILMTKITKKLSKMRGANWKDLWHQLCFAKEKLKLAPQKVVAKAGNCAPKDSQNDLWLHSGISWIHKDSSFCTKHEDRIAGQSFHFDDPLQSRAQVYSFA